MSAIPIKKVHGVPASNGKKRKKYIPRALTKMQKKLIKGLDSFCPDCKRNAQAIIDLQTSLGISKAKARNLAADMLLSAALD